MSVISKSKLKKEFLDGNTITQSTMTDLIDSTYNPNLVAGTNITLVPSGNDITINSTGGGGAGTLQDVLTAGSIGTVPTLIDIRSTGANNFFIEAGNDLNLWGINDVVINASGGNANVQAQDNVFITTAAVLGIISLSSGDINLTANANTNIGAENNINLSTVVDDIIINSAQNVDIDAGQLLTIDAVNDVEIQSTTSNVDIQAQGQVNIDSVTADISLLTHATNINLESARDIILEAGRDVIIPFADTGTAPLTGQVLAAKTAAGDMEWVDRNAGQLVVITGLMNNLFSQSGSGPGGYGHDYMEWTSNATGTDVMPIMIMPFDCELITFTARYLGSNSQGPFECTTGESFLIDIGTTTPGLPAEFEDGDWTSKTGGGLELPGTGIQRWNFNEAGTYPAKTTDHSSSPIPFSAGDNVAVVGFEDGTLDPFNTAECQCVMVFRLT